MHDTIDATAPAAAPGVAPPDHPAAASEPAAPAHPVPDHAAPDHPAPEHPGVPPRPARPIWLVVHYQRGDADYAGWGLHVWGDIAAEEVRHYPGAHPFAGEDSYGRFAWVRLAPGARDVGFLVVDRDGAKDVALDRYVDPAQTPEVWLRHGDPTIYPGRPDRVAAPASDPGVAVVHYRRPGGDYTGWGMHVWEGAARRTDWHAPLPPAGFDDFGAVFRVPLADDATGLRFVLHHGPTKDLPDDQRLDLRTTREVWLLAGMPAPVRPDLRSLGPDFDPGRSEAHWIDRHTIALPTRCAGLAAVQELVCSPDGGLRLAGGDLDGRWSSLALTPCPAGLTEQQRADRPHLAQYRAYRLDAPLETVQAALRGQVLVTGRDADGHLTGVTGVQIAGVLDDVYAAAERADLGVTIRAGRPSLGVWAPTARSVEVELTKSPDEPPRVVPMERDDDTGVWSVTGKRGWLGRYYRYRVHVWHPVAQRLVTSSVTDPYSLALAADSSHSQIVDLDAAELTPPGWRELAKPDREHPARAQIWEVSVRDFSIADGSVPAAERGTYLAFTHPDSAGMRHLRALAEAGLTHVHLLPVFDFATVPDRRADQRQPAGDLTGLPPDSAEQQRRVAAVADRDGYNWGYDPLHYTVPEGSYATEPDGAARTLQFRRMVTALAGIGLRVVMDVVYNHTVADGLHRHSVLDRIVPGYYHRLLADGAVAESTCCSNTAPEHTMMDRLIVDSVVTWARQYKIDGFRFDLMGHHPRRNIEAVRAALDRLTPERDGVDGRAVYLYGEGWNFGEVAGDARFVQATQANMAGTAVGTFNDRLRDAVRGGGSFEANPRVQGFATGLYTAPNGDPVNGDAGRQRAVLLRLHDRIKVGLSGNLAAYRLVDHTGTSVTGAEVDYNGSPTGYAAEPAETVNYVDAHDNEILYDALAYKLPIGTSALDRARLQVLALSFVVLGQGVGFIAAGSEQLRSKSLDRNSYNSGDWFNQIRWDCADGNGFGVGLPPAADNEPAWPYARPLLADPALVPGCAAIDLARDRYLELLRIRQSSPVFGLPTAEQVQQRLRFPLSGPGETPGVITMHLDATDLDPHWRSVTVVFNAAAGSVVQRVPALAGTDVSLHPVLSRSADPLLRTATAEQRSGALSVPARSVAVFVAR